MKVQRTKLRDAIALALTVGATSLLATGTASAQETTTTTDTTQQSSTPTSLDTLTVTGSRLKSQTMTASSPVAEISKEEFQYSGATKVEDLVNQYPQLSMDFDNFNNNGATGYSSMDLRDLGAQRTLTLVNGRRLPTGSSETTDVSIIPTFLVKRVDVLTGGASAVYGSDAVAGVVNFVLDDEFEGVIADVGYSAYQHDNDNSYIEGLMDAAGYDYPTGNSGFDGISRNIDLAIGGKFGENGHAVAWATWRKNEPLSQSRRDYSSCALSNAGTACGGSATSDPANFYIYSDDYDGYAHLASDGSWASGLGSLYNYAPANYYQRPDTRFTAGTSIKYEINEHAQPYLEAMFLNRKSSTQLAPSGAFFTPITVNCDTSYIGSLCSDLGITSTDDFTVYVAKRNVEGGVRATKTETTTYRIVTGVQGSINDYWSYDASVLYGRNHYTSIGTGDLLTSLITDALSTYCESSYSGDGVCYDVWNDNVTAAAVSSLTGTSTTDITTELKVLSAYVTGSLNAGLPWANGEGISLVGGLEWRNESYSRYSDWNTVTGNFSGSGGEYPDVSGSYTVKELYAEAGIPIITDADLLKRLDASVGYRYSDYSTSGSVQSYKFGLSAQLTDSVLLRASWNRAIRAPNISELYYSNAVGLYLTDDPCAGSSPEYTQAQCANLGVSASQYGNVTENPAAQYNATEGGNSSLQPEKATTFTFGVAVTPIKNLDLSVDYYDIKVDDAITTLGGDVIMQICANTGDEAYCSKVHRSSAGSLWMGGGYVDDDYDNYGSFNYSGIDGTARYSWDFGPGRFTTSFVGTYVLKKESTPVPTVNYDCAGLINTTCGVNPHWRHVANLRYAWDRYSVGLRWRYIGESHYRDTDGSLLSTDQLLVNNGNKVDAFNYFDLSGTIAFGESMEWTVGVNNIADKEPPMVGGTLVSNANALGGYDQAGRYIFTSLSFKF
ncbi:MAG: TonB-dependent receptor [Pseudoxanthomonas sp.]